MTVLHHFTCHEHLDRILREGVIRPSESNIGAPWSTPGRPSGAQVGPDVVWLLDQEDPAEHHHGLLGSVLDKRAVRISVSVPGIRWLDWAPAAQMDPAWRETFVKVGGGPAAAERWYVFPAPIRQERWTEIATLHDGAYLTQGGA